MNIMTKHGSQDNIVTYEHYCDTKADLANIPQDQISLGSVAIVLKDEDDSMGIYLANSNKEWIPFSTSGGGSSMSDISLANLIDVSLANPNDGDTLVYDATSEKWIAQAGGGNGGERIIVNAEYGWDESEQRYQNIDATYEEILDMINSEKEVVVRLRMPHFGSDVVDISYLRLEYIKDNQIKFNAIYLKIIPIAKFVYEDYVLLSEDGSVDINSYSVTLRS